MDQTIIHTPGLQIRKEAIAKAPTFDFALREVGRFQVTKNREGEQTWINIKVGPKVGARLNIRRIEDRWECSRIHAFFPKWIWGHNGKVIARHEMLLRALQRYYDVVSCLAVEGHEHRVLPGIGAENSSYWQQIEFPMHVRDPGGRLIRAFERASHSGIKKAPLIVPGETVTLQGTDLSIKAYAKAIQLLGSEAGKKCPFLRVEVMWSSDKLATYLAQARGEKPTGPTELRGFSLETLYKAFTNTLAEVQGVFAFEPLPGKPTVTATLLARIHSVTGVPVNELDVLLRSLGRMTRNTANKHLREMKRLIAHEQRLELSDFFPKNLGFEVPGISLPKEESEQSKLQLSDGPIREDLRRAYHDVNCTQAPWWRPSMNDSVPWSPPP